MTRLLLHFQPGEHRGLGPSVTKVRSLKMDKKVWTEELIELFLQIGNAVANQFWAANVPPSETITPKSSSQERRHFLIAKYREGKYRRYHPLFGNQEELNKVGGWRIRIQALGNWHVLRSVAMPQDCGISSLETLA
ncbi:arf-GAP with Rho-GAP domain, ANK repeat and PH domain-containing protein 1-like, partial [Pseudonaja textilis]|uniref:arf-GAP with Rho-GAP domain, ANK repeat and PH domain-containing protein 1-like n=1 Tax=Pseudonaja textilis TaxID=8673 RepID=UPI000EA9086E